MNRPTLFYLPKLSTPTDENSYLASTTFSHNLTTNDNEKTLVCLKKPETNEDKIETRAFITKVYESEDDDEGEDEEYDNDDTEDDTYLTSLKSVENSPYYFPITNVSYTMSAPPTNYYAQSRDTHDHGTSANAILYTDNESYSVQRPLSNNGDSTNTTSRQDRSLVPRRFQDGGYSSQNDHRSRFDNSNREQSNSQGHRSLTPEKYRLLRRRLERLHQREQSYERNKHQNSPSQTTNNHRYGSHTPPRQIVGGGDEPNLSHRHDSDDPTRGPHGGQPRPEAPQRDPHDTQPRPAAPQRDPYDTQPRPAPQRDPYDTQPRPAAPQRDPYDTQPRPAPQRDPYDTQPRPAAPQRDPYDTQPRPAATQRDPYDTQPRPAATQRDPYDTQPRPAAPRPQQHNDNIDDNYGHQPTKEYRIVSGVLVLQETQLNGQQGSNFHNSGPQVIQGTIERPLDNRPSNDEKISSNQAAHGGQPRPPSDVYQPPGGSVVQTNNNSNQATDSPNRYSTGESSTRPRSPLLPAPQPRIPDTYDFDLDYPRQGFDDDNVNNCIVSGLFPLSQSPRDNNRSNPHFQTQTDIGTNTSPPVSYLNRPGQSSSTQPIDDENAYAQLDPHSTGGSLASEPSSLRKKRNQNLNGPGNNRSGVTTYYDQDV